MRECASESKSPNCDFVRANVASPRVGDVKPWARSRPLSSDSEPPNRGRKSISRRTAKLARPVHQRVNARPVTPCGRRKSMQGSEVEPDGLDGGGGQLFGMDLEGVSPEDQAYEVAQRLVPFGPGARRQPSPPPR